MKRALVVVALLTLGCTGLTESVFELSTGGQMEITEDGGVVMTLPDGSKVVTETGGQPGEDFPIPPPWDGATPTTLTTMTKPEGQPTTIVTYDMERTREELADFYEGWMKEHATDVERKKDGAAGVVTEVVTGKIGDGAAAVSLTEAFGANSVSVIWSPDGKEGLPD